MSNTSKGPAEKGSKYWMQEVVNRPELCKTLNEMIGDPDIEWISPLAGPGKTYDEYTLNQRSLPKLRELGFPGDPQFFSFWPRRQPQWDGIALSGDHHTLYLVEAKAHISELNSKLSASSGESIRTIENTLRVVHDTYYANGDFSNWISKYYQLANRLSFLSILNEKAPYGSIKGVKLILLNFLNDHTYMSEPAPIWEQHYREVWLEMIGKQTAPDNVLVIDYDVDSLSR